MLCLQAALALCRSQVPAAKPGRCVTWVLKCCGPKRFRNHACLPSGAATAFFFMSPAALITPTKGHKSTPGSGVPVQAFLCAPVPPSARRDGISRPFREVCRPWVMAAALPFLAFWEVKMMVLSSMGMNLLPCRQEAQCSLIYDQAHSWSQ